MASFEEHCQDCIDELGEPFEEVHRWLDELHEQFGPYHRRYRHNAETVEMVRARWGDKAAQAAEIHIRKDCGGKLLSKKEWVEYYGEPHSEPFD